MTITPASLRTDLKCGKGAISPGEKCTKGPATKVQSKRSKISKAKSQKAQRNLRRATMVGLGVLTLGTGIALGVRSERRRSQRVSEFVERVVERAAAEAQRVSRLERQQQEAARSVENATDFMRGYGSSASRTTTASSPSPRGEYSPTEGSTEWKVSQAFKARIKRNTSPRKNTNPDVSAAWTRKPIRTSSAPYKGDPDVSSAFKSYRDSIWAEGFEP